MNKRRLQECYAEPDTHGESNYILPHEEEAESDLADFMESDHVMPQVTMASCHRDRDRQQLLKQGIDVTVTSCLATSRH